MNEVTMIIDELARRAFLDGLFLGVIVTMVAVVFVKFLWSLQAKQPKKSGLPQMQVDTPKPNLEPNGTKYVQMDRWEAAMEKWEREIEAQDLETRFDAIDDEFIAVYEKLKDTLLVMKDIIADQKQELEFIMRISASLEEVRNVPSIKKLIEMKRGETK